MEDFSLVLYNLTLGASFRLKLELTKGSGLYGFK